MSGFGWVAILVLTAVTELAFGNRSARAEASPMAQLSDRAVQLLFTAAVVGPALTAVVRGERVLPPVAMAGLLIGLAGVGIRLVAMVQLKGRYRMSPMAQADLPFLVTSGLYSRLRHPGYLGLIAIGAGAGLCVAGPLGILWTVPLIAVFVVRMRIEDRLLAAEFGTRYHAYRQHAAWRLLPHVY